jgi:hypothetical protein
MDTSSSAPNSTNPPLPPVPPSRPRGETHRALHDYVGQNQYEVTMKEGDLVLVTEGDAHGASLPLIGREWQLTSPRLESCQNGSWHWMGTLILSQRTPTGSPAPSFPRIIRHLGTA